MDVVLQTQADDRSLAFRALRREGRSDALQCELVIQSRGFGVVRPFWFELGQLADFVQKVKAMDRELRGVAELRTRYEENYVRLEVFKQGAVQVSGVATEFSECAQTLSFCFMTDQTVLGPFARELELLFLPEAT